MSLGPSRAWGTSETAAYVGRGGLTTRTRDVKRSGARGGGEGLSTILGTRS